MNPDTVRIIAGVIFVVLVLIIITRRNDIIGAAAIAVGRRVASAQQLPLGFVPAEITHLLHETVAFRIRIQCDGCA